MYHTDIIKLKLRQKGMPMVVTLHDGTKLIDGLPGNVIVLDQNNELGHAFRNSNSPHQTDVSGYEMVSFKYDSIVQVRTTFSKEIMKEILEELVLDAVIDIGDIEEILKTIIIDI